MVKRQFSAPLRIVSSVVIAKSVFKMVSKFSSNQFGEQPQIKGESTNPELTRGHLHLEYDTVRVLLSILL
jgi:hypothetical protein